MEQFINQFMHIYFWVYLVFLIFNCIKLKDIWNNMDSLTFKEKYLRPKTPLLLMVIGLVLFIMSFKY